MKKLGKYDFIKLLKREKPKTIDHYKKSYFFSKFEYFYEYKDYYYSTYCMDCSLSMEDLIEESGIEILEVDDE